MVCWSILRHLDRYLEEAVEGVSRILPLAAVLQRLSAIDLIKPPLYAIFVQVRIPCDDRCFAPHLDHRLQLAVRIRRVKPRDILLPNFRRPAAVQLDTYRVRRRLKVTGRNVKAAKPFAPRPFALLDHLL